MQVLRQIKNLYFGMDSKRKCGNKKERRKKTRRPEQYETKKNSVIKKEQNSKNADCGFTGRFAKRFSGERPDPLGFELTFLSELK